MIHSATEGKIDPHLKVTSRLIAHMHGVTRSFLTRRKMLFRVNESSSLPTSSRGGSPLGKLSWGIFFVNNDNNRPTISKEGGNREAPTKEKAERPMWSGPQSRQPRPYLNKSHSGRFLKRRLRALNSF